MLLGPRKQILKVGHGRVTAGDPGNPVNDAGYDHFRFTFQKVAGKMSGVTNAAAKIKKVRNV